MDYEPLDIKDSEQMSHGGPPGWIAISVIFSMAVVIIAAAFIVSLVY